jgi:peptide/nickel transport system substrate-binding protein
MKRSILTSLRAPARRTGGRLLALLTCLLLALATGPAAAKTLRVASAFDPNSLDPHALALLYHTRVVTQLYEGLVNRDRDFKLEPSLALSWQQTAPTTWRFKLRPNVQFHDGTPFTADDAVFSIQRALTRPSQRASQMRGITGARKVDALTIDIVLAAPDAVLPEKLWLVAMMSKAWAERHNVASPQDYNAKQETHAVRNANGTGPYALKTYEQDRRLVLVRNAKWWGWTESAADPKANVKEAIYSVIQSDATRLAALASGEVDFVIDPPFQDVARLRQDPRLKLTQVTDIGTQYLGFDQARPQLESSDVRDRNPFKDLRVRRAVYQAIDVDTIIAKVLRGQARATGAHLSPLVDGHVPELETRLPYDPAAARKLLTEAGYPNGFRDARLRERDLPRGRVPGDCRHAGAGEHPRDLPAQPERALLPQAHAGHRQLLRVRLDAGYRPVGDAQRHRAHVRRCRRRRLQRRPLQQRQAGRADRRHPHRAGSHAPPRAGG